MEVVDGIVVGRGSGSGIPLNSARLFRYKLNAIIAYSSERGSVSLPKSHNTFSLPSAPTKVAHVKPISSPEGSPSSGVVGDLPPYLISILSPMLSEDRIVVYMTP